MTPGPDQIVACPRCGGLARYPTLLSGNTFGARVWTDGKQIAPMLPRPPAVVKCHQCAKCYWLADAAAVGTVALWGDDRQTADPAWLNATVVQEPSEAEYHEAIECGLAANPSEEKRLRILAFQRGNDAFRKAPDEDPGASSAANLAEARRRNLEVVARMLDEANDDELILKAEVLRELGDFSLALYFLGRVKSSEFDWVVPQLRALCDNRDACVRELRLDEGP